MCEGGICGCQHTDRCQEPEISMLFVLWSQGFTIFEKKEKRELIGSPANDYVLSLEGLETYLSILYLSATVLFFCSTTPSSHNLFSHSDTTRKKHPHRILGNGQRRQEEMSL